jgi:competence protein ComEA
MNAWLERHRTLVLGIVGAALVVAAATAAIRWQRPAVITIQPPPPTATPGPLTVYVSGSVRQPDVYTLPPDAIVRDAIDAAGGPTADADLVAINLAAPLFDGQQVRMPAIVQAPPTAEGEVETGPVINYPLNINIATAAELETLPGIGPSIAETIIVYRETYGPFTNPAHVQYVSGIGPSKYEAIKDLITAQ